MKSLKVFSSICLLALFSLISGRGLGQLSINNSNTITETFSGYLGTNTFPTNWTLSGTSFMGSNQSSGTSGGWYGNSNISFLGSCCQQVKYLSYGWVPVPTYQLH